MYQRSRSSWTKHIDFILTDLLCLLISYALSFFIRFFPKGLSFNDNYNQLFFALIIIFSVFQVLLSVFLNNHHHVIRRSAYLELRSIVILAFMTLLLSSLIIYSLHISNDISRILVFLTFVLFIPIDFAARSLLKKAVKKRIRRKGSTVNRSLLIVTEQELASEIIRELRTDEYEPFDIKGLVLSNDSFTDKVDEVEVVATLNNAADYICREWIDEVLIYLPDHSESPQELLDACAEMGVTVHYVLNLLSVASRKQFIEKIGKRSVITTAYNYVEPYQAFLKRLMDIFSGLIGTVLMLILGIFIVPAIYIASPGPVLFKQRRVGKNGKPFNMLKFRTMDLDAEDRKSSLSKENIVKDGRMFKLDFDPRVIGNRVLPDGTRKTGLGEFLRRTSLDEFPQFINILKGEMSLVGTRPPTFDEWEKYEYHHRARLAIKPGLTGLWQISGRSEITDFETVVKLDTEYINNFSLHLDIKIIFKTIIVLFRKTGAM